MFLMTTVFNRNTRVIESISKTLRLLASSFTGRRIMHMVLSAKILYYDRIRLDSSMPYRSLHLNPASAHNAFCCIEFQIRQSQTQVERVFYQSRLVRLQIENLETPRLLHPRNANLSTYIRRAKQHANGTIRKAH